MALTCYECHVDCEEEEEKICSNAIACYSIRVVEADENEYFKKGCIGDRNSEQFICRTKKSVGKKANSGRYHGNCCNTSLCNNETIEHFRTSKEQEPLPLSQDGNLWLTSSFCFTAVILVIVIGFLILLYRRSKKPRHVEDPSSPITVPLNSLEGRQDIDSQDNLVAVAAGDSTLREVFDHSVTSGSGSGLPILVPRTLSNDIELIENIGKGRFGEVWRAKWKDEDVAVKIFFSREESYFKREREIYGIPMFSHVNILGYVGSDVTSVNSCTQLRLVLDYHPLGSLCDYLTVNTFALNDLILVLKSIAAGLAHLHSDIHGTHGKPAVAHRDIKSKNIILKDRTTACIGDFGLAATYYAASNTINIANDKKLGTLRYTAPEILNESIRGNFETYKMGDIYSFSLVMWEASRRAVIDGQFNDYQVPFGDVISTEPTLQDMKTIVSEQGLRPKPSDHWRTNYKMNKLVSLMEQSWSSRSGSRHTALYIKKKLESFLNLQ